jgi:2'-5' RNA ligase
MSSRIAPAVERIAPFHVSLAGASAFGKKILSIGLNDESNSLDSLYRLLESACEPVGFAKEKRSFKPHLTLARIRDDRGVQPLISKHLETKIEPVEWQVRDLVLYESKLQPTGSVYSKLKTYPLGGA